MTNLISNWCIKAENEEQAKILFPWVNKEAEKRGKNWDFIPGVKNHHKYYIYFTIITIEYSEGKKHGFKELSFREFLKFFININKNQIHEVW